MFREKVREWPEVLRKLNCLTQHARHVPAFSVLLDRRSFQLKLLALLFQVMIRTAPKTKVPLRPRFALRLMEICQLMRCLRSDDDDATRSHCRDSRQRGSCRSADFSGRPEVKPLELPPPRSEGGMPLMAALKLRRSTRQYSDRPLPAQTLSDLLWAAFGINRPSGDRTAPYWRHVMVMDIYVAMADGVWLYDPKAHTLLPYLQDDIRAQTGLQDFVATRHSTSSMSRMASA